jgi:hypothetical protein
MHHVPPNRKMPAQDITSTTRLFGVEKGEKGEKITEETKEGGNYLDFDLMTLTKQDRCAMQNVNEVVKSTSVECAQLPRNSTPCFRHQEQRPTSSSPYKKLQEATSPPRTPEPNHYRGPMIQPAVISISSPSLIIPTLLY